MALLSISVSFAAPKACGGKVKSSARIAAAWKVLAIRVLTEKSISSMKLEKCATSRKTGAVYAAPLADSVTPARAPAKISATVVVTHSVSDPLSARTKLLAA
jgi:hypothetical protein